MSLQIETQPFQFNSSLTTLDGLTASGAVKIGDNLTVLGNISASGTATFANTFFTTTSALCAVANSTGPALYIGQLGTGDLASFYDLSPTPVEVLHVGASDGIPGVGIYTSTPNKELTVVGEISATRVIYASGGNSNNWNSAYNIATLYQSTSGSFATNTSLQSTSALLTPLTTTNTLTSQLVLNTAINTLTGNWNTAYQAVSTEPYTLVDATSSIQPKRGFNTASGNYASIVGSKCSTASGRYSTIAGGFGNFNPLRSSIIGGGDFNHTGGYCATPISNTSNPTTLATASLSGNGTCTSINLGGAFGSCFSTTGTNAVSIVYTTSGAPLSAGNFAVANIVSQPNTTCIIVNGDYSVNQASSASLSATCVFVYDRLLNQNGFHSTIGGGKLNTASGQYDTVVGGIRNSAIGSCSFVGGGFRNFAQSCAAVVVGGCQNTASGQYSSILGGTGNQSPGRTAGVGAGSSNCANGNCSFIGGGISNNTGTGSTSFIGGGNTNRACGVSTSVVGGQSNCITVAGDCSVIGGGQCNNISSIYSFVAGGSANDTKGFANTFMLGTGLSASAANFTYVNNLSSQGVVVANPLRVGNSQSATGPVGSVTGKVEIFNASGTSLGFIPVYSTIT